MVRVLRHEGLGGGDHCRQLALHVAGPAAIEDAVANFRDEGVGLPLVERAGRDDVRMPREAEDRAGIAAAGPEVGHLAEDHGLDSKAERCQARGHEVLTAGVIRGHRGPAHQFHCEFQRGAHCAKISR